MNNLEPSTFFFDLQIYTPIKITSENYDDLITLLKFRGKISGYNPTIKEQTTFQGYAYLNYTDGFIQRGETEKLALKCLRTEEVFTFYIHYNPATAVFMKVGQYPSIADFHI